MNIKNLGSIIAGTARAGANKVAQGAKYAGNAVAEAARTAGTYASKGAKASINFAKELPGNVSKSYYDSRVNAGKLFKDLGDKTLKKNTESKVGKFLQQHGDDAIKNARVSQFNRLANKSENAIGWAFGRDELRDIAKNELGIAAGKTKQNTINNINEYVSGQVAERAANRAAKIDTVKGTFSNIHRTFGKGAGDAGSSVVENAVDQIEEQAGNGLQKKISNGIRKNALIGGAVGSVTGAGIGGVTAMATGADEDDTKSMILMGALAGGAAGSIAGAGSKMIRNKQATGSMWQQAAEEISKHGGKNLPVGGGAEGLIEKAKNGGTNFVNKIDDIGGNISNKLNARKERLLRNEVLEGLEKQGFDTIDAVELSQGVFGDSKIGKDLAAYGKKAGLLGGSAQGAIMGSAGGALIGGVAGGIDEDETFIGGALKGGLIGGALGGIGGGASGYFNSSGRVLSNTVENVGALFA